jgi:hypothetical protein
MESTISPVALAEITPHYVRLMPRGTSLGWCELQLTRRAKLPEDLVAELAAREPARLAVRPADFTLSLEQSPPEGGFGANRLGVVVPADDSGTGGWLVASASQEGIIAGQTALAELGVPTASIAFAPLAALRGLQQFAAHRPGDGSILVLDLGPQSHLALIDARGVRRLEVFPDLFDTIGAMVQERLKLNFRGAATLLFFNEFYDFNEHAEAIAAPCVDALRPFLEIWQAAGVAKPTRLAIPGLLCGQSWFPAAFARALGLAEFAPPLTDFTSTLGGEFETPPSATVPLLTLWSAGVQPEDPWLAAPGVPLPTAATPVPLAPVALGQRGAGSPTPDAKASRPPPAAPVPDLPPLALEPVTAPLSTPPPGHSSVTATTPARESAPVLAPVASATLDPVLATTPQVEEKPVPPSGTDSFAVPASVLAAASLLNQPAVEKPPAADDISPPASLPRLATAPTTPVPPRPAASRRPLWQLAVVALVVAVLVGAGGWFWFSNNLETERQAALAAAEQARREAEVRQRETEERIRAEEEARARAEAAVVAAQREAEAIAARAAAEAAALQAAAAVQIQARARGAVRIRTEPEGAMVRLGNGPAQPSPALVPNLPVGRQVVRISHPDFESAEITVDVVADQVAEPAPVRLVRITGSLEVDSEPAGLPVELFVADSLILTEPLRRASTPATFADLPVGAYRIRVEREGWPVHEQRAEISRQNHSTLRVDLRGTPVTLHSRPAGASVRLNGRLLGVTPLVLPDEPPLAQLYEFELDGHYPEQLLIEVGGREPIERQVRLVSYREPASVAEIDQHPVPIKQVAPRISEITSEPLRNFEIIVDRDGRVASVRAVDGPEDGISRACMEALRQWTFEPARSRGRPVPVRLVVPLRFN